MLNGGFQAFKRKPLIGMIHLAGANGEKVKRALHELEIFESEGLDGAIVENYHGGRQDVIQVLRLAKTKLVMGINILPNEFDLAFAYVGEYGARFIQLDYVAGCYDKAPRGIDFREYVMARRRHPGVFVLGGVHPKYYEPFSDLREDLCEAKTRAEAVVVTGEGTGKETPLEKIKEFRRHLGSHPLIVGAGLTPQNAYAQLRIADGAIVGSSLKEDNDTQKPVDRHKVRDLVQAVKELRPYR